MSPKIHPTALVDKGARIGPGVEIGPYAIIGPHVTVGSGCRVHGHAVIQGATEIGERCEIFPGACLGMPPQDKNFKNFRSYLRIGNENVIREHVTIHVGSKAESSTVIGDRNFLMIGTHIAHDCLVGSDIVMANLVTMGGYVTVEDHAVLGGMAGIHQFVRVGKLAMVAGQAKTVMDVPPFSLVDGNPARLLGPNAIGLKRCGFSGEDKLALKKALKILFGSGLNLAGAAPRARREFKDNPHVGYLLSFIEQSKRGITRGDVGV